MAPALTTTPERISLGKTTLQISPLGIGTWQWGDRRTWDYGKGGYTDEDLRAGFEDSLEAGINFYDTAEVYGRGRSETLLGQYVQACGRTLVIATKFMPYPWRLRKAELKEALARSLQRLGMKKVDLYQMHWPFPPRPVGSWADALADVVEAGLVSAVGVSNYSRDQMRRAYDVLARRGIPLASNQVRYNLFDRKVEKNGLLHACRELGVTLIAYSPLAQGILTGKYTPQNPIRGTRGFTYRRYLGPIQPLVGLMREIGQAHGGKSPAQVALNWVICKRAVPIPGAKNVRQSHENIGALGWLLTESELSALDAASDRVR
jgi:aryl-alcohol dehydrogenase-like predicted oxidoreductase